jgi:hypothetical protein
MDLAHLGLLVGIGDKCISFYIIICGEKLSTVANKTMIDWRPDRRPRDENFTSNFMCTHKNKARGRERFIL